MREEEKGTGTQNTGTLDHRQDQYGSLSGGDAVRLETS